MDILYPQSEAAVHYRGETWRQALFPEVTAEWEANRPDAKTGQGAVPGGRLGSTSSPS